MSIKEDLNRLERDIKRLKIEYEQYFIRRLPREPLKLRGAVERLILHYTKRNINNTALRFRFNNLVARYNSFRQYWTRVLRAMEDGTYTRRAETALLSSGEREKPEAGGPEGKKRAKPAARSDDLERVYNEYLKARRKLNKPVKGITFEKFAETVKNSRQRIEKDYRVRDTEIKVIEKNGTVRLAISPKKK